MRDSGLVAAEIIDRPVDAQPYRPAPVHTEAAAPVTMRDVLEQIEEFGSASEELIAWEFGVSVAEVSAHWRAAIDQGMIVDVGECSVSGERMFALVYY
jgi:hypothetical protein